MTAEELKRWDELHNEHGIIWAELEQYRTDIIVARKKGIINEEAEKKNKELADKLKEKDREIQDFVNKYMD